MYTETEAIVLRQVKTVGERRMITLFSKNYGKISAGTSISEKGKGKSALALRPFTLGKYELFKGRDIYNINGAETINSHYKIGEDVEKYMYASYVMELTEKLLVEEGPAPKMYHLLSDYLDAMGQRQKKFGTPTAAYLVKALYCLGTGPEVSRCVRCGKTGSFIGFDIEGGGALCEECNMAEKKNGGLIYDTKFDIVTIINYLAVTPFSKISGLVLSGEALLQVNRILKGWLEYYFDIGNLKSESYLKGLME